MSVVYISALIRGNGESIEEWSRLKKGLCSAYQLRASLKVEYRRTDSLVPYDRNPRSHSDAQIGQISASIKEFGFNNPMVKRGYRRVDLPELW